MRAVLYDTAHAESRRREPTCPVASSSTPSRALSLDLPHSMRDHWFFSPNYSQHSLARALHGVRLVTQQYCLSIRGPSVLQACTHSGGRAGGNDASTRSSTPTVHFAQAASLLRRPCTLNLCVKVLTGASSGGLGERVRLSRSALGPYLSELSTLAHINARVSSPATK